MTFKPLMTAQGSFSTSAAAVCLPLVARHPQELLLQARRAQELEPDVIEWRVDALEGLGEGSIDLESVSRLGRELREVVGSRPLILTVRAPREGGLQRALSDADRVQLLLALSPAVRPQFIDIELSTAKSERTRLQTACRESGISLVISSHDFQTTATSAELSQIFDTLMQAGADVAKLAVMPQDFLDVLRLMTVTREAANRLPIPVIGIAMGELGVASRLLATECGSALTFVSDSEGSAPGQLPLTTYRALKRAFDEGLSS